MELRNVYTKATIITATLFLLSIHTCSASTVRPNDGAADPERPFWCYECDGINLTSPTLEFCHDPSLNISLLGQTECPQPSSDKRETHVAACLKAHTSMYSNGGGELRHYYTSERRCAIVEKEQVGACDFQDSGIVEASICYCRDVSGCNAASSIVSNAITAAFIPSTILILSIKK